MGIARMGEGGSTPARLFWSFFHQVQVAKMGIFLLTSYGMCLFIGNFHHRNHQNYYYFHHRNYHLHYQNFQSSQTSSEGILPGNKRLMIILHLISGQVHTLKFSLVSWTQEKLKDYCDLLKFVSKKWVSRTRDRCERPNLANSLYWFMACRSWA